MGKIGSLSAAVIVFGTIALAATPAFAYGGHGGYGGYGGGNSYYGGSSYYPSTNSNSSSASAASASASANSTNNNNVNVNVNVPVTVIGGGYVPISQPIYPQQPIVYNYPTAPTYYGNYNYNTTPTYAYTTPSYNYNSYPTNYNTGYNYNNGYNYNTGLAATCNANTTSANIGQPVTWSANVTGGSGYYTYVWNGSSNLYGSGPSINATYNTNGQQTAQVTVTSNSGQSVTAQCTNSVLIGNGYNGNNNNTNGLTIGCASGASNVPVGTPVTWSVEVTGGSGSYTYAWSGTNGLAGSQSSVATTYTTPGVKQAVVIVTSSNGMTGSQSCTPLTVIGAGGNGGNGSGSATVTPNTNNSGLSAASLFSLSNIPWGWVAVLIILVLFGTVMYMLFNKNKI